MGEPALLFGRINPADASYASLDTAEFEDKDGAPTREGLRNDGSERKGDLKQGGVPGK